MNIAFYVSNKATRLNKILSGDHIDFIKSIKVVFSDDKENFYLKEKLDNLKIEYTLVDYNSLDCENKQKNLIISNKLLQVLSDAKIDYCFSFGSRILKGEILDIYLNRIINFHPSILPDYPGRKAIDQALRNKSNVLGNTAHFIDAGVDTGPIIMQSVVSVELFYTGGYEAILDIQIEMLYKIYNLLKRECIDIVDGKVVITGANYNSYLIFPEIIDET